MKRIFARISSAILALLIILPAMPGAVFAADDTLVISTYDELVSFAADVNGGSSYEGVTVRLTANIDLGGEGSPWTPIGTAAFPFCGVFDGGYHVISGIYIESGCSVGLFGSVSGGGVKNLVVEGSVTGSASVGGVVGTLKNGTVENCGNRAAVTGSNGVGGVVGALSGACTVKGCFNTGDVGGTTGYIGGVVGQGASGCIVSDCRSTGAVSGPATVGGILGGHKAYKTDVKNCYSVGKVTDTKGTGNNIGAVAGATRGTVENCYYLAEASGEGFNDFGTPFSGTLSASLLGDAFEDGGTYPELTWEKSISTDAPLMSGFTEKTALSAKLADMIRAAVTSAKVHNNVGSGTLLGSEAFLAGASSTATDWMALAMARFGYFDANGNYRHLIDDGDGFEDYLSAMKKYIEAAYADNSGILHSAKATEWHRAALAVKSLGGDPTNFGSYNGEPIDLIADGSYNCVINPGKQGINGWIFGLIAIDSGLFAVPAGARFTRETFITEILKMQLTDGTDGNTYGGWVLGGYGSGSDIDITAMAIQALSPYYNDDTVYTYTNAVSNEERRVTVRGCVDEALSVLSSRMDENGGFSSWGSKNVEGIAQVMVALCSLGIDPAKDSRFISSGGKTLLDGLCGFRLADGGFSHAGGGEWNYMANDQAAYALVSYWRFENGMRALYDMRGEPEKAQKNAVDAAVLAIDELPEPSSADYKAKIKAALDLFRAVPKTERRYVRNYSALAAALSLIGGEDKLYTDDPYTVRIEVTRQPNKTAYFEGELFDPSGLEITAYDSAGKSRALDASEYRISPCGELQKTDTEVFIIYETLKASVGITVEKKLPWQGSGIEDDPYLIGTADELSAFAEFVNDGNSFAGKYAALSANIDLSYMKWTPIGRTQRLAFAGTFDGRDFAVDNLFSATGGLFGYASDSAVIKNVGVAGGEVGANTGYSSFFGGIVGWSDGADIINCWNGADVFGSYSGGVVGTVRGGESVISGCFNRGNVTGAESSTRIGGIVGHLASGTNVTIENCYNTGRIVGGSDIGGIVGGMQDGPHLLKSCYNAGEVAYVSENENVNGDVGAIVGNSTRGDNTVIDCFYLGGTCTDGGMGKCTQIADTTSALGKAQMKDGTLLSSLGGAFKADPYDLVNGGYPILVWQNTDDADAVDRVIALIDAIGDVTLEDEAAILEARLAYDALDGDELRKLISNYEALLAAERALSALKDAAAKPTLPDTDKDVPSDKDGSGGSAVPPETGDKANLSVCMALMLVTLFGAALTAENGKKFSEK